MNRNGVLAAVLVSVGIAGSAMADVTWSGSQDHRAASVRFGVENGDLVVTLTNTASADALVPVDVLTAVFFSVSGEGLALIPQTAMVDAGSSVLFGGTEGGSVGGEWAFKTDPLNGYTSGISSSGLGIFGPHDRFPGINLQGPESPNGLQYGITSAGDDPGTGNTPMTGTNALIKNSVVFHLGNASNFDLNRIDGVRFQYGTSTSEPSFPGFIPAPGSAATMFLAGLACLRRRR